MPYTEFYIDGSHGSASNINGGSSSGAPLITKTNGNWNSSTRVFTFGAGDTLTSDMVGQFACVINDGGTVGAYFARVTAFDNTAKTLTLSSTATIGTAPTTATTGKTIRVGGCWAGMSGATLFPFTLSSSAANLTDSSGNMPRFNFKGSYSFTSGITNPFCGTGNKNGPLLSGYSSSPGDGGISTYTYNGTANTASVTQSAAGQYVYDAIEFKNASTVVSPTTCMGLRISTATASLRMTRCKFTDTVNQGLFLSVAGASFISLDGCEFDNCSNGKVTNGGCMLYLADTATCSVSQCVFKNSSGNAAAATARAGMQFRNCVFCDNNVPAIQLISATQACVIESVFRNNTGALLVSVASNGGTQLECVRCVFDSNGYVVNTTALTNNRNTFLSDCGYWNNTTKFDSNSAGTMEFDCFDFPASPLVDAENGDYRTRSTVGRNRVNGTITNSSKSKTTARWNDVGIGPSNPFYRGGQ